MKHYDVVAAVVCRGDKVLCMQKGKTKFPYTSFKFEFPGGKIEDGETPQQALKRELIEEMDYEVEVGEQLVKVEHEYPDFSISLDAYICTAVTDKFHMNEHISNRWCTKEELQSLDWAAADVGIVEALLKK